MGKPVKSLKDAFKNAAAGAAAVGVAASVALSAGLGPIGIAATGVMGVAAAMGFAFRNKSPGMTEAAAIAEDVCAPPEIEISVETAAPVKAMKQIKLRK